MNRLEIVEQMRNCRDFKISGLRKIMKVIERGKTSITRDMKVLSKNN